MGTTIQHASYEETIAANMGIDVPEGGLTVAHVLAHAHRTGTRAASWMPTETPAH